MSKAKPGPRQTKETGRYATMPRLSVDGYGPPDAPSDLLAANDRAAS